ncbi:hypothetical protein [Cardinium endosymbiont of Nabis limbatus]|uniref:hypothetical protein n=1 Tax=Cardinium endosymbiont of Nabis limbatus TaxID=3066217 RepID=UPI003AF3F004
MKRFNIIKAILAFFGCALLTHPSNAVGLATGPSFGLAGFRTHFDAQDPFKKVSIHNAALQIGWFAKLDIWLLYGKLDGLFILDWHKLPNKLTCNHFKSITLPLTIGIPILGILRPHIGLIFRIPWSDLDDPSLQGNHLIECYSKKINGYIIGLGLDLGHFLIDIYCKLGSSTIARKSIEATLLQGNKTYRPKEFTLRVGYNLLG